ncbi:MAG TPA: Wzz/FepE/Etk N-terminal domain-containing protein, partial [Mycobacteriales bacterium]|nr:Wzz/FepE/Etk N-terminal domain-containing protein [Mycobacteriales bacterium]
MELVDYLRVLRRRWALIALATVVCAAAAVGFSVRQTPVYEATTRLVVSGVSGEAGAKETPQRQLTIERAVTYAQFASTPPVIDEAIAAAGPGGGRPEVVA